MEIQGRILLFFTGIHNGFLNALTQLITIFGEEWILIGIAVFVYWTVSKKKGFVYCMCLLNAMTAMDIIKIIVRYPRPWTVIEGLEPVRQQTATGYSFPSGHTTCASAAYSSLAVGFRKRWLSVVCAILITLVGVSRLYLCVHWPLDVFGGLVLGCGVTFIFASVFAKLFDNRAKCISYMLRIGTLMTIAAVILVIIVMTGRTDADMHADLTVTLAVHGGFAIGMAVERKLFDFEAEKGSLAIKAGRFALGLVGVGIFLLGLKELFVIMKIYNPFTRMLRYFLVGLWGGLYPLVGSKLGLFRGKERNK